MEIWKDVKGFEEIYQVSNLGRIRSFARNPRGVILSLKNKTGWYLTTNFCYRGIRKTVRVHRLVAEAFVPNPHNKPEVNHKDGNKQNNRADNLEWVTRAENHRHALALNPDMTKGMIKYNRFIRAKIVQQFTLDGRYVAEYRNSAEAARATGVCQRNILQVANHDEYKPGKTRSQAGGYIWRFKLAAERRMSVGC
jgi:hypothetical protein